MMKGECNIIENYSKDEYCKTFAVTDVYLKLHQIFFKKNRPIPASFSFIFGLFQTIQCFTANQCEKCHVHPVYSAGIRTHDHQNMNLLPKLLDLGPVP